MQTLNSENSPALSAPGKSATRTRILEGCLKDHSTSSNRPGHHRLCIDTPLTSKNGSFSGVRPGRFFRALPGAEAPAIFVWALAGLGCRRFRRYFAPGVYVPLDHGKAIPSRL